MTIAIPRRFRGGTALEASWAFRRRFLSSAAAAGAGALGAMAMPYLSRAADRPKSLPMACNPATSAPMAAWCGRVPTGRRRCWSRSPPPSRSAMRGFCRRSRRCRRATSPRKCCWKISPPDRIFSTASDSAICRIPTFPASRSSAVSAPRPPTGATSVSSGAAMSPDRAGASIPTMAAWSPSPPCASTPRISCCIPATPSMPTASLHPR